MVFFRNIMAEHDQKEQIPHPKLELQTFSERYCVVLEVVCSKADLKLVFSATHDKERAG